MPEIVVAALYKFTPIADAPALRETLLAAMRTHGIKGTLLLAAEGLNGSISGARAGVDAFLGGLRADPRFADLEHKESYCAKNPFHRSMVKVKKEIVSFGVDGVDPSTQAGRYVEPKDWNALIADPGVIVIDTRNDYEVALGKFDGAVDPKTSAFREFPDFVAQNLDPAKHPKVAMYCTGGIRCEKASAFMRAQGFAEVYHLRGGILKYLEEIPPEQSVWRGECFVFDHRVAVGEGLAPSVLEMCHGCRAPLAAADKLAPEYEEGVSCPACFGKTSEKTKASARERHKQLRLAQARAKA